MNPYHYIQNDFHKQRSHRVGASDIPALIVNPEKPSETLYGYDRRPLTIWQEKTGRKKRDSAGLAAEMGTWNEVKCIELFMRIVFGEKVARDYRIERQKYELLKEQYRDSKIPQFDASEYQHTPIKHNTQWYNDKFIVHPDGLYHGVADTLNKKMSRAEKKELDLLLKINNIEIDLSEDFYIEAKNANAWAVKRPKDSEVKGYNFDDPTWKGIPLKHYFQMQFGMYNLGIKTGYLPLLYNSANFHFWQIKANKKHQAFVLERADIMAWCIKNDKEPTMMLVNSKDVEEMYPEINEDFVYLSGGELKTATDLQARYNTAKSQEKIWKDKKSDAAEAMSVILRDREKICDSEGNTIAVWQKRKGGEKIKALSAIKKENEKVYKYLQKNECIDKKDDTKYVSIKGVEE